MTKFECFTFCNIIYFALFILCYNMSMDKLTPKQELFCREYITDFNGTQAAIRAGYSEHTAAVIATENLQKPNIQIFLKTIMKERADKLNITQEYVLKNIVEVQQRCMQHKPVMYFDKVDKEYKQETAMVKVDITGEVKEVGIYTFDAGNANKSLDMLAKYTGFYEKDNDQKAVIIPVIKDDI